MTLHTSGIILQIENYRESDKLLTFYSKDLGKIIILARGARKIKSKLVGLCQPFTLLHLVIAPGKNFYHLIDGRAREIFSGISQDFAKINTANFLLGMVDRLVKREKKDKKIFALVVKTLKVLDSSEEKTKILACAFILKLLSFLGYQPEIRACLVCGKRVFEEAVFDFERGGLVCQRCRRHSQSEVKVSLETLSLLQDLLHKKYAFLEARPVKDENLIQAKKIIEKFLAWTA